MDIKNIGSDEIKIKDNSVVIMGRNQYEDLQKWTTLSKKNK